MNLPSSQATGQELSQEWETSFTPLETSLWINNTGKQEAQVLGLTDKVRIYSQKILPIPKKSAEEKGKDVDADTHSLGRFWAISLWDASLSSIPMKRYLVNTEDCQSPLDWISRIEAPDL